MYWSISDPTDSGGQFIDRASSYRPGIFYTNAQQYHTALQSKAALETSGRFDKPIVTEITKASTFYTAEEYHQDFYKKGPAHYNRYRSISGRDAFITKHQI